MNLYRELSEAITRSANLRQTTSVKSQNLWDAVQVALAVCSDQKCEGVDFAQFTNSYKVWGTTYGGGEFIVEIRKAAAAKAR